MTSLDLRLLGPLEVRIDGEKIDLHGNNARRLLAILLDEAGKAVPIDGIVRGIWEDELPERPIKAVRNLVSDLRRDLKPHGDRITITDGGEAYRFLVEPGELDIARSKERQARAEALRGTDPAAAAAELEAALAEWRGPALSGVPGRMIKAIARALDEDRLTLLERRFDLDLELGRHTEVLTELRQTAAKHLTRQRFSVQFMRALHADGRAVEAVDYFETVKERLAEDFGIGPDPELWAAHTEIIRADAEPAPALAPPAVPATLPPDTARFTGRRDELEALDQALAASTGTAGAAVISGMGGIGKTTLALHWAHRAAPDFPDGRLYLNLRGFDPASPQADPAPALAAALRALGVDPERVPASIDEQAGMYRTLLEGRKVLVVLDNVRNAQQVRPLLPSSAGSFTVITSRDPMVGLIAGGAWPVPLQALSTDESQRLLGRFGPVGRFDPGSRAGRRVLHVCGGLPLALSLVGAWVAAHPKASLSSLAERLESTSNVLNVFSGNDAAIDLRTVFTCSYQELGAGAAAAFRLLGLHPGPDITAAAMASLAAVAPEAAAAALRDLEEANLVEEHLPGRFTMHDLLRAFAAERLAADLPVPERLAAARRMFDHYVHTAAEADRWLGFDRERLDHGLPAEGVRPEAIHSAQSAAAWFGAEYQVLRGLVQLRSDQERADSEPLADLDERIWRLAWCLAEYTRDKLRGDDLLAAGSAALAAARRIGSPLGEAVSLAYTAVALTLTGDEEAACARVERAVAAAERHGLPWVRSLALDALEARSGG